QPHAQQVSRQSHAQQGSRRSHAQYVPAPAGRSTLAQRFSAGNRGGIDISPGGTTYSPHPFISDFIRMAPTLDPLAFPAPPKARILCSFPENIRTTRD